MAFAGHTLAKLWTVRVLVAVVLFALGGVIGIAVSPLLPAETGEFVERLVGS